MDETKKVLRSILISTPYTINVSKLDTDYKELIGYNIPFKDFGFPDLFSFLRSIPDVLIIDSDSYHAKVTLVLSNKVAHINDMVMKQKKGKHGNVGAFSSPQRPITIKKFPPPAGCRNYNRLPPRFSNFPKKPDVDTRYQNPNLIHITSNEPLLVDSHPHSNTSEDKNSPTSTKSSDDTNKNYYSDPLKIDLRLKESGEIANTSFLRRPNFASLDLNETKLEHENSFDINNYELNVEGTDFMRQLLLTKELLNSTRKASISSKNNWPDCVLEEPKFIDSKTTSDVFVSRIPEKIQENLRMLIAEFPEGIWCTKLPSEYYRRYKEDIQYEELGYRCLITLCMDLENIFHYRKESSCDYKLYDVRQPVPEYHIVQDVVIPDSSPHFRSGPSNLRSSPKKPDDTDRLLHDWSSYALLIPDDVVRPDVDLGRRFVDDTVKSGDVLDVVVAEIYDLSKFWFYINDGKLDDLMNRLQESYGINNEKYKAPETLLKVGLYCVVFFLNEYHRAQIVKLLIGNKIVNDEGIEEEREEEVKVFYIDYGTVGWVSKKQVWFLKKEFVELPGQGIRARLADIYPPVENAHWTYDAISRFQQLASMKHFEARVVNVLHNKRIVEVLLDYPGSSSPPLTLNYLFCDESLALHTSKPRAKDIHNPYCRPKVKYVHLFPYFEEIESGLVPSFVEMLQLKEKGISRDLMMPQYYDYKMDVELNEKIDKNYEKQVKKREKLVKFLRVSDLKKNYRGVKEMHSSLYGEMYEELEGRLKEWEERYEVKWSDYEDKYEEDISREKDKGLLLTKGKDYNPFLKPSIMNNPFDVLKSSDDDEEEEEDIEGKKKFWFSASSSASSSSPSDYNGRPLVDVERGRFFPKKTTKSEVLSTFSIKRNKKRVPDRKRGTPDWYMSCSTSSTSSTSSSEDDGGAVSKRVSISGSDLIRFDVEIDNPILLPEVIGSTSRKKCSVSAKKEPSRFLSDQSEEEQSDGRDVVVKKEEDLEELRSVLENAVIKNNAFVPKNNNVEENKVEETKEVAMQIRPPPGFAPMPVDVRRPPEWEVNASARFTAYEPWSTQDGGGFAPAMLNAFAQQIMRPPMAALPSMGGYCPYQPIIVFNYNGVGAAPPMGLPGAQASGWNWGNEGGMLPGGEGRK